MRPSMITIYWELYYLRHSKKNWGSCLRLQKLHCKSFWWKYIKNESPESYSGNKVQRVMFPAVSRSSAHFGFARFSLCVPDRAYKPILIHPKKACVWACPRKWLSLSQKQQLPFQFYLKIVSSIFDSFHCHTNFITIFHRSTSFWREVVQIYDISLPKKVEYKV